MANGNGNGNGAAAESILADVQEKLAKLEAAMGRPKQPLALLDDDAEQGSRPAFDWTSHTYYNTVESPGGYDFQWNSGPLKGISFTGKTQDSARRKALKAMDETPALGHIRAIYQRMDKDVIDTYDAIDEAKQSASAAKTLGYFGLAVGGVALLRALLK